MGTSNSQHRMDSGDSSSSSNRENLRDLRGRLPFRLVRLRSSLASSGQLVFEAEDSDDFDEDEAFGFCGSEIPTEDPGNTNSQLQQLKESEFSLMTKMSCGFKADLDPSCSKPPSVLKMISQREIGKRGGTGFTSCDLSNAMHCFLPNQMTVEDKYYHKAFCGTYSEDGNHFLTACQDRKLRLYKTSGRTFTLLRKIAARDVGWSILDTAFSPDGTCCVYSSWSDSIYQVRLFDDSDTQDALHLNPALSRFCVFSLVFSHDGQEILCGANDGDLYIYDRLSNQPILKIDAHYHDVNTVAYADNTSQILYSGSDDGLCKVWDRRTLSESNPHPVGVLVGHVAGITFIEPRGDGRHFLSNSKDQSIKLWDVRKFSSEQGQKESRRVVASQHWDYRYQSVPAQYKMKTIKLQGDTSVMTYRGHSVRQTLIRCHFSPAASTGQRYIYSGCAQGRIFIYDALTGLPVQILRGHQACVRDVSWHPYKPELTSTSWDSVVARWQHRADTDFSDEDGDRPESSDSSSSSSSWARNRRSGRLKRRRDT